jgi:hypothetical protein
MEAILPDYRTKKIKIDVSEKREVDYWTEKFDITKVRLKAAINAVGDSAKDVEAYLNKSSAIRRF